MHFQCNYISRLNIQRPTHASVRRNRQVTLSVSAQPRNDALKQRKKGTGNGLAHEHPTWKASYGLIPIFVHTNDFDTTRTHSLTAVSAQVWAQWITYGVESSCSSCGLDRRRQPTATRDEKEHIKVDSQTPEGAVKAKCRKRGLHTECLIQGPTSASGVGNSLIINNAVDIVVVRLQRVLRWEINPVSCLHCNSGR